MLAPCDDGWKAKLSLSYLGCSSVGRLMGTVQYTLMLLQTLSYRVDRNGGIVNQNTGAKSDILIEIPNSAYFYADASQAVKKMRIEEIDDDEPMED